MLGSAVDVVVNDWIWVARQRAEGQDFTFVPYSLAVGGVMVRPDAGVKAFADLKGKRLGVAGGPLDKSWLLLRAYARRTVGADTAGWLEPAFVAPPLLNELMLRGELPAAMNFWHYGARLQAAGMVPLLSMDEILRTLDVDAELPLVGWVFREQWAAQHPQAIRSFLRASAATKQHMLESDAVWDELRPMMKVTDDATFVALREGFRAGIPAATMGESEQVARKVFAILAAEGGPALVGKATSLASGTFWAGGLER
jgi:NitT/TauT family transport system substrate-binding protein